MTIGQAFEVSVVISGLTYMQSAADFFRSAMTPNCYINVTSVCTILS